ncbi:hypothetical protein AUJ42_03265 [Candidatus Collierbacteria bacterium CG1_02_44_10]|uniref:SCP domain-containing protein n=2 Tax=Microgenomates group TaxID=1794810 RepID=A0A1J4RTE4_9BACT|nr:MAG: hypothetical protein AUJ42_03265 [Candidatus Collierbacteria bacterium CG1_02_44_10]PIU03887.1 MAG: hypothetical protein COT44_01220 [Candidatus Shapirobacteria bacterium CG08_land_8_20_14_0_20_39_18]PJE68102.1 MAG: hypothetical protein COU94_03590 [Candidatus Shapirobacteria bacterium CG10_big_fil_rev_8_21_14_0_10_38_8]
MNLLEWAQYLFIPYHSNNYRAKVLHNQFFGYASQISPQKVIDLTNQERAKLGLAPVTLNASLNDAAQRKAGDMFAFDYWAHVSPSGREPWAFFKEVGYNYVYAGENLARDFSSGNFILATNSPYSLD